MGFPIHADWANVCRACGARNAALRPQKGSTTPYFSANWKVSTHKDSRAFRRTVERSDHWRRMALAWAVLVVACLSGCGRGREANDASTVNFLMEAMPISLDPRIGTDAYSEHLHALIFDSLVGRDEQMNIIPDLAETWETPDPLTYVFHLRRGVKFHDGRALTSADVKFTFESVLSGAVRSPKRGSFPMVKDIETPDAYTVVFHLSEPFSSFLWNLTRPGIGIVPAGAGKEEARPRLHLLPLSKKGISRA